MKSTTGGRGGTSCGFLREGAASPVRSSKMLGGAVAVVVASSLEGGLLVSAGVALAAEVGLEASSLDDGREWSWDCRPEEPGRDRAAASDIFRGSDGCSDV